MNTSKNKRQFSKQTKEIKETSHKVFDKSFIVYKRKTEDLPPILALQATPTPHTLLLALATTAPAQRVPWLKSDRLWNISLLKKKGDQTACPYIKLYIMLLYSGFKILKIYTIMQNTTGRYEDLIFTNKHHSSPSITRKVAKQIIILCSYFLLVYQHQQFQVHIFIIRILKRKILKYIF